jgi:hypothetical protein
VGVDGTVEDMSSTEFNKNVDDEGDDYLGDNDEDNAYSENNDEDKKNNYNKERRF